MTALRLLNQVVLVGFHRVRADHDLLRYYYHPVSTGVDIQAQNKLAMHRQVRLPRVKVRRKQEDQVPQASLHRQVVHLVVDTHLRVLPVQSACPLRPASILILVPLHKQAL